MNEVFGDDVNRNINDDNDDINDGVDDEYDIGHVQDSFYCSSSVLSGQQIIIIIIIMLEMVRMLIYKYD